MARDKTRTPTLEDMATRLEAAEKYRLESIDRMRDITNMREGAEDVLRHTASIVVLSRAVEALTYFDAHPDEYPTPEGRWYALLEDALEIAGQNPAHWSGSDHGSRAHENAVRDAAIAYALWLTGTNRTLTFGRRG